MRFLADKRIVFLVAVLLCIGGAVVYVAMRAQEPAAPIIEQLRISAPVRTVIGHSVEGREIIAYTYGTGSTPLLFVGGVHGGYEWNAVVLANTYKNYLDIHPESIPSTMTITVIPSLNPDGVYSVTHKEGEISETDIIDGVDTALGRTNANGVDLNRNFDCHWQPEAVWRSAPIGAGGAAFSEPESIALSKYIAKFNPVSVIFWHSQSGAVYASECDDGILPVTIDIMHAYASAAGYGEVEKFDAYPVTGDAEGWLASIGIPAITVELTTHSDIEWKENLSGIEAVVQYVAARVQ